MQRLYIVAGSLCVGLGAAGLVLPLVPATPFLLLAAACYARGSRRFHDWLLGHPKFGMLIRAFRSGAGLSRSAKVKILAVLWMSMGFSAFVVVQAPWGRIGLLVLALAISVYVLFLPTAPTGGSSEKS